MILGLTGGIASGKTTVSRIFKELGIKVVDADKIARDVSEQDDIVKRLLDTFGEEILIGNKIDRKKLREIIFRDKHNVEKINRIIHPRVIEVFQGERDRVKKDEIIIFDIPLLFESGLEYLCDEILVVATDKELQIKRIIGRDKTSREDALKIISHQMDADKKIELANYVIYNNRGLDELREEVKKFHERVKKRYCR